jgi:hypothetical protein
MRYMRSGGIFLFMSVVKMSMTNREAKLRIAVNSYKFIDNMGDV